MLQNKLIVFRCPFLLYLTKQGTGPMASLLTHLLTIGGPNTEIRAKDLWCAQFCYILKSLTLSATATLAPFSSRRDTIPVCFFCVALRRGVSPSCSGKEKKSRPLMRVICPGYFKSKAPFMFSNSAI